MINTGHFAGHLRRETAAAVLADYKRNST